jgi:hypothetical protein
MRAERTGMGNRKDRGGGDVPSYRRGRKGAGDKREGRFDIARTGTEMEGDGTGLTERMETLGRLRYPDGE